LASPSVTSVRLLGGLLLATAPRIEWAKLRKRTFGLDVLRCGHCGSRLRLLAALTDKATARKILEHLALPHTWSQPALRAREGTEVWADTPAAPS
jgi:hypothetical protein